MGAVFALGFLAVAAVVLLILGGLALSGIILLIVYLVQRSKKKKRGEKASKAPLVASLIFLTLPVGVLIWFAASTISNKITQMSYEDFTDKWKNETVFDNEAEDDAINGIFSAADSGDKEKIMALFTDEIQADPALEEQVDLFLAAYETGFSGLEYDSTGGGSSGGGGVSTFSSGGTVTKDGELYYIRIYACHENDEHPEKVGIEGFEMYSSKAKALEMNDEAYTDERYIRCEIEVAKDFDVRIIGGDPYRYTEIERSLTAAEVEAAVEASRNTDDLAARIGKPNAVWNDMYYVYELSDGEEYRYAKVSYSEPFDFVHHVYFEEEQAVK